MMFLGLVGTTLGCLSPDAILMRFGLAHRTAEAYFVAHGLDVVPVRPGRVLGHDPGLAKSCNRLGSRIR
eukprot:577025-Rhodomonas_salina.1